MILNMIVSTGSTDAVVVTKSIIFYGAPSETLTLYGSSQYDITLDLNGTATATIPTGDYILIGSASQSTLPTGRSVSVTSSTTSITAYPPNTLFWYGNGDASGDTLYSLCGGFSDEYQYYYPSDVSKRGYLTDNTMYNNATNFRMTMNANAPDGSIYYIASASMFMKKTINSTGYTKLKIKASGNGTFYTTTVTPSNGASNYSYVSKANVNGGVITLTPSTYLAYYYTGQAAMIRGELIIEAIWLE